MEKEYNNNRKVIHIPMPTVRQIKRKQLLKSIPKYILKTLLFAGAIVIAGQSPYFSRNILREIKRRGIKSLVDDRPTRQKYSNAFSRLRSQGFIIFEKRGQQLFIRLTDEGRKRAGVFQINDLEIAQPKVWDGKWRVLIFDIPEKTRVKREVLRGKLKELGFYLIQKSVWVHAYQCTEELKLLKHFFGFTSKDYLYIETTNLGPRESELREYFRIT
ncbi:MAG: hypothetical protein WC659_02535 [Patescibacteria group bacterium]